MTALPRLATVEALPGFTFIDWTQDDRVAPLLAMARANPPALVEVRGILGPDDTALAYGGAVVRDLGRIRAEYREPLLRLSDAGNKAPYLRWCADTVEVVLCRELAGAGEEFVEGFRVEAA